MSLFRFFRDVLRISLMSFMGVFLSWSAVFAQPFSEIRGGVYAHDVPFLQNSKETRSPDINLDLLFKKPFSWTGVYVPRPHIGMTVNTGGGTSLFYAGGEWTVELVQDMFFHDDGFLLGFSFDAAVHDGPTGKYVGPNPNTFGCRWAFHESLSAQYRIGSNLLMLTGEHMSNGGLCRSNDGITNFGIRYGYRF